MMAGDLRDLLDRHRVRYRAADHPVVVLPAFHRSMRRARSMTSAIRPTAIMSNAVRPPHMGFGVSSHMSTPSGVYVTSRIDRSSASSSSAMHSMIAR
jgi:hypothetical protein